MSAEKTTRVIILSNGKMFGPFPEQEVAHEWYSSQQDLGGKPEFYSVWESETGTAERANECGTRLPSIEDLEKTGKQSRRA